MNIEHFKDEMLCDFTPGDDIVIQEKIDGSNASFIYDEASDSIIAFSRNYLLDSENTLRGFWEWTQTLVSEKFRETHTPKRRHPTEKQLETQTQMSENMKLAKTVVTHARIEKILHKMVDDGIIPENWGRNEIGIIMKNLGKLVYEDCVKEEPDIVAQAESFGKASNKIISSELKKIMLDRIR